MCLGVHPINLTIGRERAISNKQRLEGQINSYQNTHTQIYNLLAGNIL